ncbi:MAG: hypothetical protein ACI4AE_04360, partial [Candidatus Cryptobacteroides sp.]
GELAPRALPAGAVALSVTGVERLDVGETTTGASLMVALAAGLGGISGSDKQSDAGFQNLMP